MTDIGELVVRIKADAAQLEREMRKANNVVKQSTDDMSSSLKDLKGQFGALLPALTAAAVVNFGRIALSEADHINDLAMRVGFLGSTLSALDIPLRQSGSSLDEFTGSVVRMNNMVGEARKGGQEQIKAFDALGLSVRKLEQLSPEDQFYSIAEALSKVKDQSEFTNLGISIFGRSFASIAPLIKESEGNLRDFVNQMKLSGEALSDDQLRRIDEWGDRWTAAIAHAKLALVDYLDFFYKLGQEHRKLFDEYMGTKVMPSGAIVSTERPEGAFGIKDWKTQFGPGMPASLSAKGGNAGLIKDTKLDTAKKALADYNRELANTNTVLQATPREQDAVEARLKTKHLADEAGIKDASAMIAKNEELARSNYDLKESMQEAARFQQELHDKLSSSLTDIAFSFDSAGDSAKRFAEAIAQAIFERKFASPIADAIVGKGGNPGLFDGLFKSFGGFFADGGRPPVGVPSIVGENGPEIFVPNSSGTIIPNGAGGNSVAVHQTIILNPGATEQTVAQLKNLVPTIAAAAQASVFAELQRGGSGSRIAGLRS